MGHSKNLGAATGITVLTTHFMFIACYREFHSTSLHFTSGLCNRAELGPGFCFGLSLVRPTHRLYVESLSSTVGLAGETYSFWERL
jgi:hypothetical protein